MAKVQYESKDDGAHRFWTARYGRYAIRIDANRPGLYRWVITLEGRSIRKGMRTIDPADPTMRERYALTEQIRY
jgi:hypothetical protein